jgi:hypothetical protein
LRCSQKQQTPDLGCGALRRDGMGGPGRPCFVC